MSTSSAPTVAIAGATGYIGQAACRFLSEGFRVVGLTRRATTHPELPGVEWRVCDLYSYLECERALADVDAAIYLVHSMIPSAQLTQGTFRDMDLILADNFVRAARVCGVRHLLYLGGLVPSGTPGHLSRHLESRLEVEQVLGAQGIPLTTLRASIVIGAYGSSFSIFRTLLERLPYVPCPRWSHSLTQPVALSDVLRLMRFCLEHPEETRGTFDIACPEALSYHDLLVRTAQRMGLARRFFDLPFQGSILCKVWLCLITGAPMALVAPLVESMRFPMIAGEHRLQAFAGATAMDLDQALDEALAEERRVPEHPPVAHPAEPAHYDVRSVQRLPLPSGRTARWVADQYIRWLPWIFRSVLACEEDVDRHVRITLRCCGCHLSLLELTFRPDRSPETQRQVYFITGGLLAKSVEQPSRRPRLEFREVLEGRAVLMAIHDYQPSLPPWLYAYTQAVAHVLVTRQFARHLLRLGSQATGPS